MNKTNVLNIFETFAGIGAQHKALSNIKSKLLKVVQTSEWDARAIIAYSQIHNKKKFNEELIKVKKWTDKRINDYLIERTFSLNSKVPGRVWTKPRDFKEVLIAANKANNNLPDITKVHGNNIKNIDLITYSFPCQGLSIANMGRDKGIKEDVNSTSNLIWEIYRILKEADNENIELPKYLLMENVKNLLSKKHMPDFQRWLKVLEGFGYVTYYFVLNAKKHRALQRRERVFAISIKDHKKIWNNDELKTLIEKEYGHSLKLAEREKKYSEIMTSSNKYRDELIDALPNNTPSRRKMRDENHNLLLRNWMKNHEYMFNTLTTKQDRHPNVGMVKSKIKIEGKLDHRFVTAREAYQIMNFDSSDFSSVKPLYKKGYISKESLYRQAGNSIVVSVLEDIFSFIEDFERGKYE